MNTLQYLMSHLPVIGRDTILENLRVVRGSYSRAQSVVRDLETAAKRIKFEDEYLKSFNAMYMGAMQDKLGSKNFIEHYSNALPNVIANMSLLEDVITDSLEESLATKATTYKNATLLQLTEACDFALSYGLSVINHAIATETRLIQMKNGIAEEDLEAPTAEPIVEKLVAMNEPFVRVMSILSRPSGDIGKSLDEIPDILVEKDNFHTLSKTIGAAKIDPLNIEAIKNFTGNPLLYWGRRRVEKQNMKYRQAQETIQVLKLRKLNLERALAGKQDAALERQIRVLQSRIEEITREIEKMES